MFDDITEKHREIEKIVLKNAHRFPGNFLVYKKPLRYNKTQVRK